MRKLFFFVGFICVFIFSVFVVELLNNSKCPKDIGELLRYSLYSDFNSDYVMTSMSVSSRFINILVGRNCSYELEVTGSQKKIFIAQIEALGTWKPQPACSSLTTRKYCNDNLEKISVIDSVGLICVSHVNKNTTRIQLSCKDIY